MLIVQMYPVPIQAENHASNLTLYSSECTVYDLMVIFQLLNITTCNLKNIFIIINLWEYYFDLVQGYKGLK